MDRGSLVGKDKKNEKHEFFNHAFAKTNNPTDIIWENRNFSTYETHLREFKAYSMILLVLLFSFGLVYYLSIEQIL